MKTTRACFPHFVLFSVSHMSTLSPHISFRLHFNSSVTLADNTSVYTLIETPPPFPSLIARLLLTGSRLYARRNLWLAPRVGGWWKGRGHVPPSTLKGEAHPSDIGSSAGSAASSGLLHVTVTSHVWCHALGLHRSQLVSCHTSFIVLQQKQRQSHTRFKNRSRQQGL